MANKPRPKCSKDGTAMQPLFRKRPRGGFQRAGSVYQCGQCDNVAVSRSRPTILDPKGRVLELGTSGPRTATKRRDSGAGKVAPV